MDQETLKNMSPEEILELQKKNCIFCKIINKEIPSKIIYEDDKSMVILDINPANEGHCLVLPKTHYQIMPQMPPDLIGHLSVVSKKISKTLLKSLSLQGTTLFIANGALAGQKAPHFMMHVIPRKPGDLLMQIKKGAADNLPDVRDKLASRLGMKQISTVQEPSIAKKKEEPGKESTENPETKKSADLDKISELFK